MITRTPWTLCAVGFCGALGCGKSNATDAGAPTPSALATVRPFRPGPSSSRPLVAEATQFAPHDTRPIWMRDSGTRVPFITPLAPSANPWFHPDAAAPPAPEVRRAPDWDLSPDDPGRDYARRYAFFTKRYQDFSCIDFGAGEAVPEGKRVVVKTAAGCSGGGTVRDVFLVDVAGDHLTVDDKSKRDPLARWPDGSDPEGPPTDGVRETTNMKDWKSPLQKVFLDQSLAPMRMQSYGRGTYPVISIAGWHGPYQLNAPADAIQPLADALCSANDNMPLAIVAGFDRAHVLRIRCPAASRWDLFQ